MQQFSLKKVYFKSNANKIEEYLKNKTNETNKNF